MNFTSDSPDPRTDARKKAQGYEMKLASLLSEAAVALRKRLDDEPGCASAHLFAECRNCRDRFLLARIVKELRK